MSYSNLLLRSIEIYDLSVGGWVATPARLAAGARTALGFVDVSFKAVHYESKEVEETLADKLVKWSRPFSPELWWTFVGMSCVTSLLYCCVEHRSNYEHLE
eukprot:4088417-Amphidinium_carterae.1